MVAANERKAERLVEEIQRLKVCLTVAKYFQFIFPFKLFKD